VGIWQIWVYGQNLLNDSEWYQILGSGQMFESFAKCGKY
jgi:hypothetical protein